MSQLHRSVIDFTDVEASEKQTKKHYRQVTIIGVVSAILMSTKSRQGVKKSFTTVDRCYNVIFQPISRITYKMPNILYAVSEERSVCQYYLHPPTPTGVIINVVKVS